MKGIGGNLIGIIQTKTTTVNQIGERISTWADAKRLKGWLDLQTGSARNGSFDAKIEESTHVFICDYTDLSGIDSENSRMVINGKRYDIRLIDNPMEMGSGSQLEIYLKYTGGQ